MKNGVHITIISKCTFLPYIHEIVRCLLRLFISSVCLLVRPLLAPPLQYVLVDVVVREEHHHGEHEDDGEQRDLGSDSVRRSLMRFASLR